MDELENNLHKTREFLEEIIDSDCGLIDKLRSRGILNIREIQDIRAENTSIRQNSLLLDVIAKKKKISELCEALKDTGQQHIVNYLKECGERSPQFDEDWPLTQKEILIIESNHESLIDILDTCDLIGRLYSNAVINRRHLDLISSKSTSYKKNEALLEILRRCSLRSYKQTIRCLRESNQDHIAEILEAGGAIVPVHATVDADNLTEIETQIVNAVTDLLMQRNVSPGQANRVLSAAQLNIMTIKRGQSIVLFIFCCKENELNRLCTMIKNSEMKNFLEQLFNLLICNKRRITVLSVKIFEKDLEKTKQFLETIHGKVQISQLTPTTINDIPMEITDVIIQKSFSISIQIKSQTGDEEDQDSFKKLSEVNECWFERMTNRRFKNDCWIYLSGIYERRNSISTFWKNNQQFIEENLIQLRIDANRLKRLDLLSDIQCALIAKASSTIKKMQFSTKAIDLSSVLNYKHETNINLFIEYLRSSGQRWIAKTMRHCGISVRVEIDSRVSIKGKKMTRFFQDSGTEILGSIKDKDFVRWIWSKSSNTVEKKQSKYLRHNFCQLFSETPQCVNQIRVNVDSDQLKKEAVVFPQIFDESLEAIGEHCYGVGVTKLKQEFFCLGNNPNILKVFDDRYPFALLRKFQLNAISMPYDIVSNEKENTVYILDIRLDALHTLSFLDIRPSPSVCVWKIEQNTKTKQNEIKWLELPDDFQPLTISMSKSGQLLMVSRKPSPSLRVYGPDAQHRLSISLHQIIENPIHAVETSIGNFVILHDLAKEFERMITVLSRDRKTIVRNYQPENQEQRMTAFYAGYLSVDSNDRVFVADSGNDRVILLDSNFGWNRILFSNNARKDEDRGKKLSHPKRLYYDEAKRQLVVCGIYGVNVLPISC